MTHIYLRSIPAAALLALASATSVQAAPQCPPGMSVTADGKTCAAGTAAVGDPAGSFDVLGNIMDTTKKEINAKEAVAKSQEDFFKTDYYRKHKEGYWSYFQASSSAKPGEFCTAMFVKEGLAVSILGPGGQYKGALMMFMPLVENPDFPTSPQPRVIKVGLKQANDPQVTVGVFNMAIGAQEAPAVAFAVPTIEAALGGMDDKLDFRLSYEGKDIASIEWHSGQAARDELKKCLAARKK